MISDQNILFLNICQIIDQITWLPFCISERSLEPSLPNEDLVQPKGIWLHHHYALMLRHWTVTLAFDCFVRGPWTALLLALRFPLEQKQHPRIFSLVVCKQRPNQTSGSQGRPKFGGLLWIYEDLRFPSDKLWKSKHRIVLSNHQLTLMGCF